MRYLRNMKRDIHVGPKIEFITTAGMLYLFTESTNTYTI